MAVAEAWLTGENAHSNEAKAPINTAAIAQVGLVQPSERIAVELEKAHHKLRPDEVIALVAGYQAGTTIRALSRQFVVHGQTVRAHLRRAGVVLRPLRALTEAQKLEAVRLYGDEQWSLVEVAVRGWSVSSVQDAGTAGGEAAACCRASTAAVRTRGNGVNGKTVERLPKDMGELLVRWLVPRQELNDRPRKTLGWQQPVEVLPRLLES